MYPELILVYLAVKFTIFRNSLKYLTIFCIVTVFSVEVNWDCGGEPLAKMSHNFSWIRHIPGQAS